MKPQMWQCEELEMTKFVIAEFDPNSTFVATPDCFQISTCQRTLFLTSLHPQIKKTFSTARRLFIGPDAYEFLLRFSSGLESEIKGETDVFGQVKTAFKNLSSQNSRLAELLQPIFLKLFEDTKEIRAQFLQGIGGNTYGALARRLLNPSPSDRVLVIGAGDISKSVSPYFSDFQLTIWNRSNNRLLELHQDFAKKGIQASLLSDENSLSTEIQNASLIIIATPFGSIEKTLESALIQNTSSNKRILHLGAQSKETTKLGFSCLSLTDLFEMEREQGELREKQVRQAMQACHERALLRSLARSIHIAHGWEDLAVFI